MKKLFPFLNLLFIAAVIFWGYYANSGQLNDNSMGSLSLEYNNFFTPASYAFSIWGLIYLAIIVQAIYFLYLLFTRSELLYPSKTWLIWLSTHLFNIAWIYVWLTEQTALSVGVMILLLSTLLYVSEQTGRLSFKSPQARWMYQTPVRLYTGWIIVALVANISAFLSKIEWSFLFHPQTWAILLVIISTGIYAILINRKKWVIPTYVGVWSLLAIAVEQAGKASQVQYTAIACSLMLIGFLIAFYRKKTRKGTFS